MFDLLDGPMGTRLEELGATLDGPPWSASANVRCPDRVLAVHVSYERLGVDVHRANTFRTQPKLFPKTFREEVTRAVALARAAAGARSGARVAGCLAPIEDCYRPDLAPDDATARRLHGALAEALRAAGCDLLLCETFPSAREVRVAVEQAVATGLETWVGLTAGPDGALLTPGSMRDAARACVDRGAAAVLVGCTAARLTLPYVEALGPVRARVGVYANAGDATDAMGWGAPELAAAARYAELASTWLAAGAVIVGSCCGTGPAHIAALASLRGGVG